MTTKTSLDGTGFGNIHPLGVRNILTRGQQVPFVIRWQKVMSLDFTRTFTPNIIPYQPLSFWTGTWDDTPTQNMLTFQHLLDASTGITFNYSDLTIELFAVTRERLLQQGTTNVTTFDFEDGQHLYITRADRDYEIYTVSQLSDLNPQKLRCVTHREWHRYADSYTRIAQIPPNMAWTHRFTWPQLDHGYMWDLARTTRIQHPTAYAVLMPGAQGVGKTSATTLTHQREMIADHSYQDNHNTFTGSTTQPRVAYPRMHLTPPYVADETGFMRFRFVIRMIAETHTIIHLLPDHTNDPVPIMTPDDITTDTPLYWRGQTIYMPILSTGNAKMKELTFPCFPYTVNI